MSYVPPQLPATWHEGAPPPAHATVDLAAAPSVADDLRGLEPWRAYCQAYREGQGKDYGDLRELGCFRRAGVDRAGNPLYLVVPGSMRADTDLRRVRRLAVQEMHAHASEDNPFSVVFVQNNVNPSARAVSPWFVWETYRMLPRPFKKNLRMLGVVHPTAFTRTCLLMLAPFLSDSFWDKLYIVERLEFLDDVLGRGPERVASLGLPKEYAEWDKELDDRAKEDEEALRSGTMYPHAAGMGSAMGGAVFQGMPVR
eukprot:CAMPEP_0206053026 /NCGR_PEP_ID=MMETSP1466-20131121/34953_1 /ASSEMBLY_ACC=CAM_ASM_001126 /TAXON_ID=44452 /ORGANISM="Pavlova gyrans, Strain CCMP608" /LENGTH=254 /DNA_ID=CAMNT_0053428187 /DNA_START=103 /DNA_END=867 /DNA_ORIENTATION=-